MMCKRLIFSFLVAVIAGHSVVIMAQELPFTTLLTTAAEREALNQLRERGFQPKPDNAQAVVKPSEKTLPKVNLPEVKSNPIAVLPKKNLSLSGYIVRADGRQQIWINGKKLEDDYDVNAVVSSTLQSDVLIQSGDHKIPLKVGQQWQENTDTIIDVYQTP